jgi:hypothetical protein
MNGIQIDHGAGDHDVESRPIFSVHPLPNCLVFVFCFSVLGKS